jgi:hypothetical protein
VPEVPQPSRAQGQGGAVSVTTPATGLTETELEEHERCYCGDNAMGHSRIGRDIAALIAEVRRLRSDLGVLLRVHARLMADVEIERAARLSLDGRCKCGGPSCF